MLLSGYGRVVHAQLHQCHDARATPTPLAGRVRRPCAPRPVRLRLCLTRPSFNDMPVCLARRAPPQAEYKPGRAVFRRGDPGTDFYIVKEGTALVSCKEPPNRVQMIMYGHD